MYTLACMSFKEHSVVGVHWMFALLKVVSQRQKGLLQPWSEVGERVYSPGQQRKKKPMMQRSMMALAWLGMDVLRLLLFQGSENGKVDRPDL